MITGFNTDVEHEGVVYHVQTEDKGLASPLILSLVYVGGAILASKRSRYEDLIAAGFDEEALTERLNRQHRLICAAIRAGRVEDLKRMNVREPAAEGQELAAPGTVATQDIGAPGVVETQDNGLADTVVASREESSEPGQTPVPASISAEAEAYVVFDSRRQAPPEVIGDSQEGLRVSLIEEQEFHSGESLTLGVLVTYKSAGQEKPLSGVTVSVKVLGTTFRPSIVSVKTRRDGVAVISTDIPQFASGRAAILVRAVKGGDSVEIRRVVHPTG